MLRFMNIKNPPRPQRRRSSLNSLASSLNPLLNFSFPSKDELNSFPSAEAVRSFDVEDGSARKAVIERLGCQRPRCFSSLWAEIAFCFSVSMSQILTEYFLSGFIFLLPQLMQEMNIPSSSAIWPASVFSLVIASTLLIFGRLSDMYGPYYLYLGGLTWLSTWSIVAGFSENQLLLNFCRALQGLGPAAFLPSGIMLIGQTYRPGPRKNFVFSIYGASSVIGFFVGMLFAGAAGQNSSLSTYFWIGAGLTSFTACVAFFCIPSKSLSRTSSTSMDWSGSLLILFGLVLVTFAITDSAHAPKGWATAYIPATFIVGLLSLGGAVYVEGWVSENPLLPADLFSIKCMKPLCVALFFNYGTTAVFLLYTVLYFRDIMGVSPFQMVAWFVPLGVAGVTLATTGGFLMHIIPGTMLLVVSGAGWIGASLLLALMPNGANYWAFVFPSMILATIGIDITFNVANVFITTSIPSARQGLAGALTNSILHLSMAILLGAADIIQTHTASLGLRCSYQNVFWFMLAISSVALCLMFFFVKIEKAMSDLTADERKALQKFETASPKSEDILVQGYNFTTHELKALEGVGASMRGTEKSDVSVPDEIQQGIRRPSEGLVMMEMPRRPASVARVV